MKNMIKQSLSKKLIPIIAMAAMLLPSCGGQAPSSSSSSEYVSSPEYVMQESSIAKKYIKEYQTWRDDRNQKASKQNAIWLRADDVLKEASVTTDNDEKKFDFAMPSSEIKSYVKDSTQNILLTGATTTKQAVLIDIVNKNEATSQSTESTANANALILQANTTGTSDSSTPDYFVTYSDVDDSNKFSAFCSGNKYSNENGGDSITWKWDAGTKKYSVSSSSSSGLIKLIMINKYITTDGKSWDSASSDFTIYDTDAPTASSDSIVLDFSKETYNYCSYSNSVITLDKNASNLTSAILGRYEDNDRDEQMKITYYSDNTYSQAGQIDAQIAMKSLQGATMSAHSLISKDIYYIITDTAGNQSNRGVASVTLKDDIAPYLADKVTLTRKDSISLGIGQSDYYPFSDYKADIVKKFNESFAVCDELTYPNGRDISSEETNIDKPSGNPEFTPKDAFGNEGSMIKDTSDNLYVSGNTKSKLLYNSDKTMSYKYDDRSGKVVLALCNITLKDADIESSLISKEFTINRIYDHTYPVEEIFMDTNEAYLKSLDLRGTSIKTILGGVIIRSYTDKGIVDLRSDSAISLHQDSVFLLSEKGVAVYARYSDLVGWPDYSFIINGILARNDGSLYSVHLNATSDVISDDKIKKLFRYNDLDISEQDPANITIIRDTY